MAATTMFTNHIRHATPPDTTPPATAPTCQVFDFAAIKQLFAREDFSMIYDSMNGVQGPYAHRVFVDCFGTCGHS